MEQQLALMKFTQRCVIENIIENAIGSCQKKKTCDRIAMNSVQKRGEILWLISEKELYSTDGFRE
jgi:hypothetical protein